MLVKILRKHREFSAGEKVTVPDARAEAMLDMEVAEQVKRKRGRPRKKK